MSAAASPNPASQIKELKVSAHTMALEPGLYCVFNAPGGPAAANESGLPGVRITAAPGARGGQVSVAGFNADGWIGADAGVLVRVQEHSADVLVTVYQVPGSTAEPPKLQVVRLSGDAVPDQAAPGQPETAAKPAKSAPENVEVVAHIYARGDVPGRLGDWMGEAGSQRWIEGFGISPARGVPPSDIEYQAVLGRGWLSPWSEGGQFCGSRGMSLPILGLRARLRGGSASTHRVVLSAAFVDGTKVGPVHDGDACEAPSLAALEAFQVSIEPKPGKAAREMRSSAGAPGPAAKAAPAAKQKPVAPKAATKATTKPAAVKVTPAKPAPAKAGKKPASKRG